MLSAQSCDRNAATAAANTHLDNGSWKPRIPTFLRGDRIAPRTTSPPSHRCCLQVFTMLSSSHATAAKRISTHPPTSGDVHTTERTEHCSHAAARPLHGREGDPPIQVAVQHLCGAHVVEYIPTCLTVQRSYTYHMKYVLPNMEDNGCLRECITVVVISSTHRH